LEVWFGRYSQAKLKNQTLTIIGIRRSSRYGAENGNKPPEWAGLGTVAGPGFWIGAEAALQTVTRSNC
jgi:hypothetical protein